jgi:hypothetical protein
VELSAFAKPLEATGTVLTCYEEGLRDPDPRTRAIHIDHVIHMISSEKIVPNQVPEESYISRVVDVLKANGKFDGICGIFRHLGLEPESSIDCWSLHDFEDGFLTSVRKSRCPCVHEKRSSECMQLVKSAQRVRRKKYTALSS